jgi:hypothetical protein
MGWCVVCVQFLVGDVGGRLVKMQLRGRQLGCIHSAMQNLVGKLGICQPIFDYLGR